MAIEIRKNRNPGLSVALDSNSIDFTTAGSSLTGVVRISSNAADAGNTIVPINVESTGVVGLRAQIANEDIQDVAFAALTDTASIDLTYDDALNQVRADLLLSADPADAGFFLAGVSIEPDGLKVQIEDLAIDHGSISGLADDDHTQYALLAGRGTGQVLNGGLAAGNSLTLMSTANATKGQIILGSSAYDEALQRLAIRDTSPGVALDVNGDFGLRPTDNTDAGALPGVPTADTSFIRFSLATEIQGLANGAEGKLLILANINSVTCIVRNQNGTAAAADRIITGTGDDIELATGASLLLAYDGTTGRWRVIGGAGGGALSIKANQTLTAAATIVLAGTGQQLIRVEGDGGAITVSATTGVTNGTKDGQQLRLQGLSDTNTVTITAAGNMRLNGDCVLGQADILDLQWDHGDTKWTEVSRSE